MRFSVSIVVGLFFIGLFWGCEKDTDPASGPEAYFSVDTSIVQRGDTIHFVNESQNAISCVWDFGDGYYSDEQNPDHIYENSGKYNVILSAINGADTNTYSGEIFIKDITVMTYNIAFSGGAVPDLYEMWNNDGYSAWTSDRRSELLKIIRQVNPDILGIQEAFVWDSDEPKVYERFADSLGMEYYYYPEYEEAEWNGICIFSKFPIESTAFYLHQPCVSDQTYNGTYSVKSVLRITDNRTIDIYSCHLMFQVPGAQTCEVENLSETLKTGFNPNTILMGDMNYNISRNNGEYYYQLLSESGLSYLHSENETEGPQYIDQIWSSANLYDKSLVYNYYNIERLFDTETRQLLDVASDHYPAVAFFGF